MAADKEDLHLVPTISVLRPRLREGSVGDERGAVARPEWLSLTGTSALSGKGGRARELAVAAHDVGRLTQGPSGHDRGAKRQGQASHSQLASVRGAVSSVDQLPVPRAMQIGSRVNIGEQLTHSQKQFARLRGQGQVQLSKNNSIREAKTVAAAQGMPGLQPRAKRGKGQWGQVASTELLLAREGLHDRLKKTFRAGSRAQAPTLVLDAMSQQPPGPLPPNPVLKQPKAFQSLFGYDTSDPYGSRRTRNGLRLHATDRKLAQQFRSAGNLSVRKASQRAVPVAEYEGMPLGPQPAGRTADKVVRYFQQMAVPTLPMTRSQERFPGALHEEAAATSTTLGGQARLADRSPAKRPLGKAIQSEMNRTTVDDGKAARTLQVTVAQTPEERSLTETVHFPDLVSGLDAATATTDQQAPQPTQAAGLLSQIYLIYPHEGGTHMPGGGRRGPHSGFSGLDRQQPRDKRRIPTKRRKKSTQRPIWGAFGSRHQQEHQRSQGSSEGVGYLTEHLSSTNQLLAPPTDYNDDEGKSMAETSASQIATRANAPRHLKDESELVVKDLKWYENSKEQRWRRSELRRVLRRRSKVTQAMDEDIMLKRLAG